MKLVSAVPLDEGQRARLESIMPLDIVDSPSFMNANVGELVDKETHIVYAFRVPNDLLDRAPSLRWLQLLGAGCDHLVGNPIFDSPVAVTTASGVHATPIAEYVLGVMLSFYRWLPQAHRAQMERRWIEQADVARGSRELRRRTIGIIGYGSIGREVARLAKPFGTRILAVKRSPSAVEELGYRVENTGDATGELADEIHGPDELPQVLSECDVVVLAVPSTAETHRMIGADQLAAMKPGSYLINIARGNVIDESALIDALREGPMAGAALDVFEEEPLPPESPLWEMENVLVTPHISGASRPHLRRIFELFAQNMERFQKGEPLLNLVDEEIGY